MLDRPLSAHTFGSGPGRLLRGLSRGLLRGLLGVLLLCGPHACGGKDAPPPKPYQAPQNAESPQAVKWTWMPGGLTLNITASPDLNSYDGYSHNVLLCIYQLDAPAAFAELAATQGGIRRLLACDRFDKSVLHYERQFISPSANATMRLDRAEGAQFVGLAAGYYDLQPGLVTRTGQFPLNVSQEGWLFWKSDVYNPGVLTMDLLFGPKSIQRTGGE